jgi:hypothetical protein
VGEPCSLSLICRDSLQGCQFLWSCGIIISVMQHCKCEAGKYRNFTERQHTALFTSDKITTSLNIHTPSPLSPPFPSVSHALETRKFLRAKRDRQGEKKGIGTHFRLRYTNKHCQAVLGNPTKGQSLISPPSLFSDVDPLKFPREIACVRGSIRGCGSPRCARRPDFSGTG